MTENNNLKLVRSFDELVDFCQKEKKNILKNLNFNKDDKNKVESLSTNDISKILRNALNIIIKDGNIAFYAKEKGHYVLDFNNTLIKQLCLVIEPNIVSRQIEEVIFKIKFGVYKFNKDNCLSDFEPVFEDKKRYVLVKNGIFDKETKTLNELTAQCIRLTNIPYNYKEFETEPKINNWCVTKWIEDMMSRDDECIELAWQVLSACLTNRSYRKAVWLYGSGANGKSTFTALIENLVGKSNVGHLRAEQFSDRFSLSTILNKTVVIGDDVNAKRVNSENYNSVVTADPVLIERKHEQAFSTIIETTVIQSANELPKFSNKTNATTRRMIILPFLKSYLNNTNFSIKEDYIRRDEILEFVLFKSLNMNFDEFIEPKISLELKEDFKKENNHVVDFMSELFESVSADKVPSFFIWQAYKAWIKENEIKSSEVLTKSALLKSVRENLPSNCLWKKVRTSTFAFETEMKSYIPFKGLSKSELNQIKETFSLQKMQYGVVLQN